MSEFDVEEIEDVGVLTGGELVQPMRYPERPRSPKTVRSIFHTPATALCQSGVVQLPEPLANHQYLVHVHDKLQLFFQDFLTSVHSQGYWPLVQSVTGFKNMILRGRVPRGGDARRSPTCWGIALIINEHYQGNKIYPEPTGEPVSLTSEGEPGYRFYPGHPIVVISESMGLTWCGRQTWENGKKNSRPDGGLFVYAGLWDV